MNDLRIISFLPAATEMVFALGLGEHLVGVSHECDSPQEARARPVVVRPALPLEKMSLREIDVAVAERIGSGQSLYQVDEDLLRELKPDLILTQDLCQVCGPAGNEITVVLKLLDPKPEILWMSPHSLEDIFQNVVELGRVTGRSMEAEQIVASGRKRLGALAAGRRVGVEGMEKLAGGMPAVTEDCPRVFCMEWADPIYCAGHWVPEMVEIAGGVDGLARRGTDSVRISWDDVRKWAPEVMVLSPCGFHTAQAVEQVPLLKSLPGWSEIPAVRNGRVYCVDANSYFARPGPRVVEGTELLAHLIHPELFNWNGPADAFQRVS
jgi:iron complex transport system substrate-binding protein